ncbi:hypothetical protein F5X68DRAFT_187584 [Plectosphaerella plurivora]|uniref:Altered inheritance of mitochondria protein 9, mitochondrial n=1 Tax=Plectosphaerella plurivora TaxID=936078 RepID=A0A9P8VL04_9PEZI|nr:hypothetical protein F5X68DRAFT_187584 [Plectosphaerella plurivora]
MSSMGSSAFGGRSASGALSNTSFASSTTSTSPYHLPRLVATSKDSGSIKNIHRLRAEHLEPFIDKYSTDFKKDFQDWEYNWTAQIDEDVAAEILNFIRKEYNLPIKKDTAVSYLGGGSYNKAFAFLTDCPPGEAHGLPKFLVLRIGWPLAPHAKLESEVATMTFARVEAGLPVPAVYWYDSSAQNKWKVEWSIMEFAEGTEYRNAAVLLDNPTCDTNKRLVEAIAEHCERLGDCRTFDQIGSLYFAEHGRNTTGIMGREGYVVGPSTHHLFWFGPRAYYKDLPRGPFNTVTEYLSAHCELHIRDCLNSHIPDAAFNYDTSCTCATKYSKSNTCPHVKKMRANLLKLARDVQSKIVPAAAAHAEPRARSNGFTGPLGGCESRLWHHDLHAENLMLNKNAATSTNYSNPPIAAMLDFECLEVAPRMLSHPVPKIAYSFAFDQQDCCRFPIGDSNEALGPSLGELFAGSAKTNKVCPKAFCPPYECQAPWGVALLNLDTRIKRMCQMLDDDVEWFINALDFLGFPRGDDYGLYDNDSDDSDSSGDGYAGSADGFAGGSGHKRHDNGPGDGKSQRRLTNRKPPGKYVPDFLRRREYRPIRTIWPVPPRSQPFDPEEFLKMPPKSTRRPLPLNFPFVQANVPQVVDQTVDVPSVDITGEQSETLDDVPLTPRPSNVQTPQPQYEPNMTMQVPLQDLLQGMDNRLTTIDRPHDAVPGSPWTQQVTQAPPVTRAPWLPVFISTFLCCY